MITERSTNVDPDDHRVQFDFEVEFLNGGGLQGQGFRLDIVGDNISDDELAGTLVRDLRLLMVGDLRIRDKQILVERHKRAATATVADAGRDRCTRIDLSHTVEDGMVTYPGLPAPVIGDFLSRAQSRAHYAPGTEFQIGQLTMCANTGTYLDSPFHRYADSDDLAALPLDRLADLDAVRVNLVGSADRGIGPLQLLPYDLADKAVLIHTGWDRHWRTDRYFQGHPFLTEPAARHLLHQGAVLVGIDSLNIDDTASRERPVHSTLLAAGIPICEHLTNLGALPTDGFRFSSVPVKVKGMGTFPVRAYATIHHG
jgi:kynurenine formamidase